MESVTDVLVVGGGPVGLQLTLELQRRGVRHLAIDQRPRPDYFCKALGVSPRTLEVWDQCGVLPAALRRGMFLSGIESCVDQGEIACETIPPGRTPYGFFVLPQYDSEEILREELARRGGAVQQGLKLISLTQDADGVRAHLADAAGVEQTVACRYLAGCDGAHSAVRKSLGIDYEGDAYPMTFMLADVLVHWNRRHAFGQRITHLEEGELRNVLVCIPIPGDPRRYRLSMAAPLEYQVDDADLATPPSLATIQATVEPMLPPGATISDLRWSSFYRISHRIVSRYSAGRCFLLGDAAHIHPPIGGQGMNTGIQDAHNLAWKLALVTAGRAPADLLDSYDEERRPVGLDVVQRTSRRMDESISTGDVKFDQWMEDSQLLIHYRDSRWVAEDVASGALANGPRPGDRAPDAPGLRHEWIAHPLRLEERMRVPGYLLLLYFDAAARSDDFARAAQFADELRDRYGDAIVVDGVLAPAATAVDHERFPLLRDQDAAFGRAYGATGSCLYLLRPDRHVAYRADGHDGAGLRRYLDRALRARA
jgi:2-polyprenyl-6-methoxyphenol hydroxylase-like FAD-dependent oxidoreductase